MKRYEKKLIITMQKIRYQPLAGFKEALHFIPGFIFLCFLLLFAANVCAASGWSHQRMIEEPYFGGEMLVREAGQEHPDLVLLVHGLGDEAGTTWDLLVPELAKRYHVVAPDLPGFGRSSKGNHRYGPEAYAVILDSLVKTLPDKPLSLVGHSLGGAASLIYAAQHGNELEKLILIDAVGTLQRLALSQYYVKQQIQLDIPLFSEKIESSLGKVAGLLLEKTSRLPLDPGVVLDSEGLRERFLQGDPSRIAALALAETDYSLILPAITTPTWLLWGDRDQVAPLRIAKLLDWNVAHSELELLPGLGHTPMLESPDAFNLLILDCLSRAPKVTAPGKMRVDAPQGFCDGERGRTFHGAYSTLSIWRCQDVRLDNVIAEHIEIIDSEVVIQSSKLKPGSFQSAIRVSHSRLTMTGVDIDAETGIVTNQSRLDLAGVRFFGARIAVKGEGNPSSLIFSSSLKTRGGKKAALHLSRSINAGAEL